MLLKDPYPLGFINLVMHTSSWCAFTLTARTYVSVGGLFLSCQRPLCLNSLKFPRIYISPGATLKPMVLSEEEILTAKIQSV